MKKLVRVIRLQPGEAVLIMAEDKPAPVPCGCVCMVVEENREDTSFPQELLIHLDGVA